MKAQVTIVDDHGNVFQGDVELTATNAARRARKEHEKSDIVPKKSSPETGKLDFEMNPRAFMNRYASNLSGSQKFTLLLACLVKGESGKTVQLAEIMKIWDKMEGVIGRSNTAFANRAKTNGWVDSPKYGGYVLTKRWREIFGN